MHADDMKLAPGSLRSVYSRDVQQGLGRARTRAEVLVTDADLAPLPALVRTYLQRVGVVGKPRVFDLEVRFVAQMKPTRGATAFMNGTVEQTSFFDEPTRLFLMSAKRAGIPFHALHRYVGEHATMQVRVASLFDIVDARGPEMDQSETVTLFNDLCVLAPATLPFADVRWEEVDGRSVRGTFTNAGHTIGAVLTFDGQGDLVGFVSNDRYQSSDGKTYLRYPWSTPLHDYRVFDGYRIASRGEGVWKEPQGDFEYGRFEVVHLRVNRGGATTIT